MRKLAWVGVKAAHCSGLLLSSTSGKLIGTNCAQVSSKATSLSATPAAQRLNSCHCRQGAFHRWRLYFPFSSSVSCVVTSWFELSAGCEGNGEIFCTGLLFSACSK